MPATGVDAWTSPDPSCAPAARLDPWLEVTVTSTWGDWAQIQCSNGWSAWVDGRVLVPRTARAEAPVEAPVEVAAAPPPGVSHWAARARAQWAALVGAALVVLGSVLPWMEIGGQSADGTDVPLEFLLSYKSTTDLGLDLGVVVLALGVAGAIATLVAPDARWRGVIGCAAVAVALVYVAQVAAMLNAASSAGRPSLLSTVGFGVWITIVGGAALAFGPQVMAAATRDRAGAPRAG